MSGYAVLKVFKTNENAVVPVYGTSFSACFDITACFKGLDSIKAYDNENEKIEIKVQEDPESTEPFVVIEPGNRCLVPTGLIFDLPSYFSLRIHPRSGLALKNGITLINCEGVIDSDYVDETFLTLVNYSTVPYRLYSGSRAAQGELVNMENMVSQVRVLPYPPKRVGNRTGGLGSTGV